MATMVEILALPSVTYGQRRDLPDCSGVYFAVIDQESLAYVGSTGSLRDRWRCHDKRRELLAMGELQVHYVVCPDDFPSNFIEQDVIEAFSPPLNRAPARWGVRPDPGMWLPAALSRRPRPPAAE